MNASSSLVLQLQRLDLDLIRHKMSTPALMAILNVVPTIYDDSSLVPGQRVDTRIEKGNVANCSFGRRPETLE